MGLGVVVVAFGLDPDSGVAQGFHRLAHADARDFKFDPEPGRPVPQFLLMVFMAFPLYFRVVAVFCSVENTLAWPREEAKSKDDYFTEMCHLLWKEAGFPASILLALSLAFSEYNFAVPTGDILVIASGFSDPECSRVSPEFLLNPNAGCLHHEAGRSGLKRLRPFEVSLMKCP